MCVLYVSADLDYYPKRSAANPLRRLADEAGLRDTESFARSFHILLMGLIIAASEGDTNAARRGKSVACLLIEQHRWGAAPLVLEPLGAQLNHERDPCIKPAAMQLLDLRVRWASAAMKNALDIVKRVDRLAVCFPRLWHLGLAHLACHTRKCPARDSHRRKLADYEALLGQGAGDDRRGPRLALGRGGAWSLAPAYDVIWAWQPGNLWLDSHQMSINGKRDGFTVADLHTVGRVAGLKRGRAEAILEEVGGVVASWREVADEVGVDERMAEQIARSHRLRLPAL